MLDFLMIERKIDKSDILAINSWIDDLYYNERAISEEDMYELHEYVKHCLEVDRKEGLRKILNMETLPREVFNDLLRRKFGKFEWKKQSPNETKRVTISGAKIMLKLVEAPGIPPTLVLFNHGKMFWAIRTFDEEYKKFSDESTLLHEKDKYLLWAETVLANSGVCSKCNTFKVLDHQGSGNLTCHECPK